MATNDRVTLTDEDESIIAQSKSRWMMVGDSYRETCKLTARRRAHECGAQPFFWRRYAAASVPPVIRIA